MSSLEFQINLAGNFATSVGHASKELEVFEGEIGKASAGIAGFEFNLEALSKGGSLFTFDLAEGIKDAVELVDKLVERFIDLGCEMVHAAGDAQDLNLAVKLDVGEEGLEKVSQLAESFSGSRFGPKAIKEALLPILEESGDELSGQWDDLVTAATDISVRSKGRTGAAAALEALRSIEIRPEKIGGALKQLGIRQKDFYSDLGDLFGISAASAQKQVKAGEIKAKSLLSVALHQIAEREGGALGNATNAGTDTLGGTLDRLAMLKDKLFEGVADSPGMHAVQGFLNNLVETLEGPLGQELVSKLSGAFATIFGDLSGPQGLARVQAGVAAVATKVEQMVAAFQAAWPTIEAALVALPGTLNEILTIAEEFAVIWTGAKLVNGVSAFITILNSAGLTGGLTALRTGLNSALSPVAALTIAFEAWRYAFEKIGETITQLGGLHQVVQDFRDWMGGNNASGIAYENHVTDSSPQWKKDRVAQKQADGTIPMFADGGYVDSPTLAVVGEAGPEWIIPARKMGGRRGLNDAAFGGGDAGDGDRPAVSIGEIVVHVGEHASDDARGFGQDIGQAVRIELKRFLDEVAA